MLKTMSFFDFTDIYTKIIGNKSVVTDRPKYASYGKV